MSARAFYRSSPVKRRRRTKAQMDAIRAAIYRALELNQPMTVRQVFYRLTSAGVIAKSEAGYGTVKRLTAELGLVGHPQMVLRVGRAPIGSTTTGGHTNRRPVDDVLEIR